MQRFFTLPSRTHLGQDPVQPKESIKNQLQLLWSSTLSLGLVIAAGISAQAAETVHAKYSQLEVSLAVSELETYAASGQPTPLIETLEALLNPEQIQQVRGALTQKFEVPAPVLARFFSTPSGYRLLEDLTEVVQAKSNSTDNVIALRTAVILAASSDDSLSLLSLLRSFPDAGVSIDLEQGLRIFERLTAEVEMHQSTIEEIKQRSQKGSKSSSKASLAHYFSTGPYRWNRRTFTLKDKRPIRLEVAGKPRTFPLDLYLPQRSSTAPVIVLSHGFGSSRSAYRYFAEHLASHGYAVAVPEHPGSSFRHWKALLQNKTNVIASPLDFVERPLDIQYILDVLTEKNDKDPSLKARLDLDKVGMFGHSYGGYTALATAGAKLDLDTIKRTCNQDLLAAFNPSLLLQCQAAQLPASVPDVSDPRVKAVFVSHPILSAVLGENGLASVKVPVTVLAGGADRIAPLVPEQVNPYGQITSSAERTFVLLEQSNHFSPVGDLPAQEAVFDFVEGGSRRVSEKARTTLKTLGLAFFQARFNPESTSSEPFLSLVRSLNEPNFPVYGLVGFEDAWAAKIEPDHPH